jgi:hypothetical protein
VEDALEQRLAHLAVHAHRGLGEGVERHLALEGDQRAVAEFNALLWARISQ